MKEFKKANQNRGTKKMMGKLKVWKIKLMLSAAAFCLWFNGFYCLADANYGEKAGNWILDQLFWVGLVVMAVILISCLLKRAWVGALITAVAGAVILVFIKNPQLLSNIGQNIVDNVFN